MADEREDPGRWIQYPTVREFAGKVLERIEPVPGPTMDLCEELLLHFQDGTMASITSGHDARLRIEVTR